eukprot:Phypoly_transcript_01720.p1 GENE.Phypoly_transcript_01720~~Phypoly_transcript_01720.p1  ORF type:complete len:354 (+),score=40.96 Phypoly_transcript_01720:2132-3193(+)
MKKEQILYIFLFFISSAIWGSAFLFMKIAVDEIPPLTATSLRLLSGICGLSLTVLGFFVGNRDTFPSEFKKLLNIATISKLFFLGCVNNVIPVACVAYGEDYTNSGIASVIVASTPIVTALVAHFVLADERLTLLKSIGFLFGLSGLILVSLQGILGKGARGSTGLIIVGHVLIIITAVSYGIGAVFVRKYIKLHPVVAAFGQVFCAVVVSVILSLAFDYTMPPSPYKHHFAFFKDLKYQAWIGVLYQGIGSTWIGFLIYYFLITRIGASRMMLAWMLFPLFGVFEGAIFLHEWSHASLFFKLSEVAGAILVMCGLIFIARDKENVAKAPEEMRITKPLLAVVDVNGEEKYAI